MVFPCLFLELSHRLSSTHSCPKTTDKENQVEIFFIIIFFSPFFVLFFEQHSKVTWHFAAGGWAPGQPVGAKLCASGIAS